VSLTSFLKIRDVKLRFLTEFPKEHTTLRGEILAPVMTVNPSRIGTAFDYLMRFYLEWLNPNCHTNPWVAETSLSLLDEDPSLLKKATEIVTNAKSAYLDYKQSGKMTDEVLKSTLLLAQVDLIYRAGIIEPDLGQSRSEDVLDLRNLIGVVNPGLFKAQRLCVLNPTFGEASGLVGGADADFLLDDVLVEIKTTKNLRFDRDYFNQLVGYYILSRIGGTIGTVANAKIARLGVYYSRHGLLHTFDVGFIENHPGLEQFIEWFEERAREEFPSPW